MSRRPGPLEPGLQALRAAVAAARLDEVRAGRADRIAGGTLHRGARAALRIGSRRRQAAGAGDPDGASSLRPAIPEPAEPGDEAGGRAPDGEAAEALRLVERTQAGSAEAFGELYDRYVEKVYRYIRFRVADHQLAEDLTSETFLRAMRRIDSFAWQGRDVGAWFVTIARNLVFDHHKSSRYRLELTTDDVTASGSVPVSPGPENTVIARQQTAALLDAVRRLNPEQQECIALRFLQGLSVAETAQIMARTEGAVKALQHRALRALGRLLPDDRAQLA